MQNETETVVPDEEAEVFEVPEVGPERMDEAPVSEADDADYFDRRDDEPDSEATLGLTWGPY